MEFPFIKRSIYLEALDKFQDLTQEYQNFRRRNADIQGSAYQSGQNDAIIALLPVYDNLLRALEQPCQDEAYVTGIRMTQKSLLKAFEALGITEIPALGQSFDPVLHEALEHIEDEALAENTIAKVVQCGFRRDDRVLRPALVIVAN